MLRKTQLALAIIAAVGLVPATYAAEDGFLTIDYNGTSAGLQYETSLLDWVPGNVLATPTEEGQNAADPQEGDILQTYVQAKLGTIGAINPANGEYTEFAPSGLGLDFEWTYVMGFQEEVVAISEDTFSATFRVVEGGNNFFEIWYDAPPDASNVNGTGFADGTRVLWGTVDVFDGTNGETSFTNTLVVDPDTGELVVEITDLDLFAGAAPGINNYPDIQSVSGTGGGNISITVTGFNPNFIKDTDLVTLLLSFDTQLNLAFDKVDPSSCFWTGSAYISGAGPNNAAGTECSTNNLGAINGIDGPYNQIQTDSSTAFITERVPEPATLSLLGLGLFGMAAVGRRRRKV